ncbi:Prohormone-1 [Trachymyrmex septentrionalis]|uniref:Prohormone-1 n=1 Tax=Trachymyrmex septentrionalis TaxID=34720 RepID=A0A151JT81_9HYME|nr:PREDICTED: allatostatin C-like [Trachymyrmex septentrionalis]KYN31907.1 Prohormone-1 [Trachymyrmex septentrionalis]
MLSVQSTVALALMLFILVEYSAAMPTTDKDKARFLNNVNLVDDDGSIDKALMNYLFTKQIVKRLRNQMNVNDLQRKRNFWRQCSLNAVACFGK